MVNIKAARINAGLSGEALGRLVGVSGATISGWENGKKNPRRDNLERLAAVLDVSVDYLLGKTEDPVQIDMDRVDADLYKQLQDITPSEKAKVLAFVAGLKANRTE